MGLWIGSVDGVYDGVCCDIVIVRTGCVCIPVEQHRQWPLER